MARNTKIQILVDLIKLISSSPIDQDTEVILENIIKQLILDNASTSTYGTVIILNADPTTADLPVNTSGIFKNTISGQVSVWVNDNGVMRSLISAA